MVAACTGHLATASQASGKGRGKPACTMNTTRASAYASADALGLDPLFWTAPALWICDVLSVPPYTGIAAADKANTPIYMYGNRPIHRIQVFGIIVAAWTYTSRIVFAVDDGTGCIECVRFQNNVNDEILAKELGVGVQVLVEGKINIFQNNRQLKVDTHSVEPSPDAQSLYWLRTTQNYKEVYDRDLVLCEDKVALFSPTNTQSGSGVVGSGMKRNHASLLAGEDCFLDYLLGHLNTHRLHTFPFKVLLTIEAVVSEATRVIQETYGDHGRISSHRITSLVSRSLHRLSDMGEVFILDTEKDIWEVVSHDRNLGPALLDIVAAAGSFGLSRQEILARLKSHRLFCCIPWSKVSI